MLFSRGSSQPKDWTQVSCITGRFFTIWATKEAGPSCLPKGYEFEQMLGDSGGQGSLACYSPWSHKELYMIEWLNNNNHFACPLAVNENSCCSTSSSAFDVIAVFYFSHSNKGVVVPHCCFNLKFPIDTWHQASFPVLNCHLHIFFGEVFI